MEKENYVGIEAVPVEASAPAVYAHQPAGYAPTAIVAQPPGGDYGAPPTFVDFGRFKPIPPEFLRVDALGSACGLKTDFPDCIGYKTLLRCCCFECETNQCRIIENDAQACCLLSLLSVEIVDFADTCKCYTQLLCCEMVSGCPLDEAYIDTPAVTLTNYGAIDVNHLYPCYSTCCFCHGSIDSWYMKWPQCIGIYTHSENCCFYTSNACLKPMCLDDSNPKKNLQYLCVRNRCMCVRPRVCCKDQSQIFCCDHRNACPYDEEVVCAYVLPFTSFTICIDYRCVGRCCMTYGELLQFYREGRSRDTAVN